MLFIILLIYLAACSAAPSDSTPTPQGTGLRTADIVGVSSDSRRSRAATEELDASLPRETPAGILCFQKAYGTAITAVVEQGEKWFVEVNHSTKLIWDDGRDKSFEEKLRAPDLEDQISISYPRGPLVGAPRENEDPGRFRVEAFFKAIYGSNSKEVKGRLGRVRWLPRHSGIELRFNRNNGAARQLSKVSMELDELLSETMLQYVSKPAGTFNWRQIKGTQSLSAHAYGIAVDINIDKSHYWRWEEARGSRSYKNTIPYEIVRVFEKHGFIWGGKWYHFDTMHFEYRPELLVPGC